MPTRSARSRRLGEGEEGTGELALDMKTFTLEGTIDPTYAQDPKVKQVPITAKLACELLDEQAINF